MNEVKIFEHEKFGKVRTLLIDGEPWFVLSDVCKVLELSSPHKVANRLDNDEKGRTLIPTLGGQQEMSVINESGLYAVIIRSDKSQAKPFRKWITSDVLPSIRKHGVYATPEMVEKFAYNPEFMIKVFTELLHEQQKNKKLTAENAVLTKKCSYLDIITKSENAIPITVIAKDYGMTAQELNGLLHFLGIQYKLKCGTWVLYQEYADCGYTKSKTFVYDDEKNGTSVHTYWTQRGRMFLYEKLKSIDVLPRCEREVVS
jgi:prophage antirepressor-like protein